MAPTRPPFDTCCCLAVRKAARHVTGHYDRHLAPAGLTVTQFSVLWHVDRLGEPTVSALAGALATDRTTMGRTLRPLERDGLLAIGADAADGRRRPISLTDIGRERLRAARPLWAEAQARFDDAFGSASTRTLRDILAAVLATDLESGAVPSAPFPAPV